MNQRLFIVMLLVVAITSACARRAAAPSDDRGRSPVIQLKESETSAKAPTDKKLEWPPVFDPGSNLPDNSGHGRSILIALAGFGALAGTYVASIFAPPIASHIFKVIVEKWNKRFGKAPAVAAAAAMADPVATNTPVSAEDQVALQQVSSAAKKILGIDPSRNISPTEVEAAREKLRGGLDRELVNAILAGHPNVAIARMNQVDVTATNALEMNYFYVLALSAGSEEDVKKIGKELARRGLDINQVNSIGAPAVTLVRSKARLESFVDHLQANCVDPLIEGKETVLMSFIVDSPLGEERDGMVKFLLERGVPPDSKLSLNEKFDGTRAAKVPGSLYAAIQDGNSAMMLTLRDGGAELNPLEGGGTELARIAALPESSADPNARIYSAETKRLLAGRIINHRSFSEEYVNWQAEKPQSLWADPSKPEYDSTINILTQLKERGDSTAAEILKLVNEKLGLRPPSERPEDKRRAEEPQGQEGQGQKKPPRTKSRRLPGIPR